MLTELDKAIAEFMQEQANLSMHNAGHWRCFYNEQGNIVDIVFGPPWQSDLPYVEITAEQQARVSFRDKVINGKLIMVDYRQPNVLKLIESPDGEYRTVANHMNILLDPAENYSDVKHYTQVTGRHS